MAMTEKEEKLVKKIQKDLPEFYDSLQGLTVDELKEKLATYAKHREETIKFKEDNAEIKNAREKLSELEAPFKERLKEFNLRTKYIYLLMQEKGGA